MNKKSIYIVCFVLNLLLVFLPICSIYSETADEEEKTNKTELETKTDQINLQDRLKKAQDLKKAISILEEKIEETKKSILETHEKIIETQSSIEDKTEEIFYAQQQIDQKMIILAEYLRSLYILDQDTHLEIVLKNNHFSQYWNNLEYTQNLGEKTKEVLNNIQQLKIHLMYEKGKLEEAKDELKALESSYKLQKESLETERKTKEEALKSTILDIEKLIIELNKMGEVTLEKNLPYFKKLVNLAKLAGEKTGVRPALILAVIKQESNLGSNVGTGFFPDDMRPGHRDAFVEICQNLGLDPEQTPVSKKPQSYPGWGGAMGPAQIMPNYWEFIEARVIELTRHNPPSPWDLEDAFTGCAIILARNGANFKTHEKEFRATGIYFAGGAWQEFKWYPEQVMLKAQIYEDLLDI